MSGEYEDFLASKARVAHHCGFDIKPQSLPARAFSFQRDIITWALRLGRAAVFAGTGLGKSLILLSWADQVERHEERPFLILAPLAVAQQTVREGELISVRATYVKEASEIVGGRGIYITNYDRFDKFDPSMFCGVAADESSILKSYSSSTTTLMIESWRNTRFRLACTATPSPNDVMELANHAEFLGVMSRVEMLATFFVHDGGETQKWRIKGHAEKDFWQWVSSWAVMMTSPSDLGYDGSMYELPPLEIVEHIVESKSTDTGTLFALEAQTLNERRNARRSSIAERVAVVESIVAKEPNEPWLIWCDLNDEADAIKAAVPHAVEVRGSDDVRDKESRLLGFASGAHQILISKARIAGFGLNYQHCARMIFCGVSDSFEQFYQAIRRCYRFGQNRTVVVHVVTSSAENAVLQNLKRKERAAQTMVAEMVRQVQIHSAVGDGPRLQSSARTQASHTLPSWLIASGAE